MDNLVHYLKIAARPLWRSPGFAITVVLTLALAIGANTAIFSVVNALLLEDLPYAHPDRMGAIYLRVTGAESFDKGRWVDGEQWELLRDDVPSVIAAVSGIRTSGVNLQASSHVQYLQSGRVSAHYFDVLAVHPVLGRNFTVEEDLPHGPRTAILSYGLWRTTFHGDSNVLGESILLKGEPYTIVGVLPEQATTPLNADIYTALQPSREGEGQSTNFVAILRLRDGATWQQANSEIDRALNQSSRARQILQDDPHAKATYYAVPLQKAQTSTLRPQVLSLILAAAIILLIACANLAGLALVRMLRRTSEIATRQALGASQWQIQRQLWIENLPLALLGGTAGIAVGFLALRRLLMLLPAHFLPVADVRLDTRVLAFTLFLSVFTSLLFGMLPAFATRKMDLWVAITSRAITGGGRIRLRQGLIAGEVGLTMVLLAAAGLMLRTLIHFETMPPGFSATGVITAKASLDDVRYHDPAAFRKLLNESLAAMREIPGVQSAAVGLTLPYERALIDGVSLAGSEDAGTTISADSVYITPGYFATLQIPLLAGRTFTDSDSPDAQPVVLVNETFARKFFRTRNPVGRYLKRNDKDLLVIGVVGDILGSTASRTSIPGPLVSNETIYLPAAQIDDPKFLSIVHAWYQPSWIVRAARPVEGLTGQMQRALEKAAPNLSFSGFYSMNDLMTATLATQRVEAALLVVMASLALLLSTVGIFALVANLVVQRRREIGIRLALGSTIQRAMIHVGSLGVRASAAGLLAGLVLCAGVLRAMRSVIFGVGVYDAPTILVVVAMLAAVTLLATAVPVLRVSRIDPAKTLREE